MSELKVGILALLTMASIVFMSLKITSFQSGFGEYINYRTILKDASGIFPKQFRSNILGAENIIQAALDTEVMNIIGDVKGKECFIIDDIVDSAGTLCNASDALIREGATKVYSYVTHGVLSGKAVERVNKSSLTKLLITDTIEESDAVKKSDKIDVISISSLLGEAIKRISDEKSVSSLFD